ncbi:MAG: maleate cis-trans isomerase family protein [Xanthobacteraceae bacterium]
MTKRIGLIIPSSNQLTEPEYHRYLPDGTLAHFARLRMTGAHRLPLPDLLPRIAEAALSLADAKCEVIAFHCTAIALDAGPTGEPQIMAAIAENTGVAATATASAIIAALRALGARRIGLVTPYDEANAEKERRYFDAAGIEIAGARHFDLANSNRLASTPPEFWIEAARGVAREKPRADAVVFSGANVRCMESIPEFESILAVPAITSNQAVMWDALRRLGTHVPADPRLGRLFS